MVNRRPSCADLEQGAMTPDQAKRAILDAIVPVSSRESIPIQDALDRVLADDIISPIAVPAHVNSAMDGYAIRAADLPQKGTKDLTLIGTGWAGKAFPSAVAAGQCVRIMTGAVLPEGADTVVIQEYAQQIGDIVRIGSETRPGANVRQAGEDIPAGELVLEQGRQLTAADLGLLASLGLASVWVKKRPVVAFFSTGDELIGIGESPAEGMIYDSNRYTLLGMLTRLGVEIVDMGIIKDNKERLYQALVEATGVADMVLSSGGVSVGEADYVRAVLTQLGEINFWKVAMKPGRPLTFGRIDQSFFFGLPGNPVSVMVTFYQFVQPALKKIMGHNVVESPHFIVPCHSRLRKRPGRVEYQRGILAYDSHHRLVVSKTGQQGSGILRSMSAANCFIILPLDNAGVEPGEAVCVQPFYGLFG